MSCENCLKGFVLPGEPVGSIKSDWDGAYFTPGPQEGYTKRAVVLLTDIFGLPLKNNKILADHFAKELKCDVWVPDLFAGESLPRRIQKYSDIYHAHLTRQPTYECRRDGAPHARPCRGSIHAHEQTSLRGQNSATYWGYVPYQACCR